MCIRDSPRHSKWHNLKVGDRIRIYRDPLPDKEFFVEPVAKSSRNKVEKIYENKVMKNHHGGVVLVGDHLYGHNDMAWICQDFKTGAEVWNHKGPGKGAVATADGMLYCLDETNGNVVLAEATPAGWKERGRFKLDPQTKVRSPRGGIWTHPVISHGKLYLRDQDLISCYDIKSAPRSADVSR